MSKTKLIGVNLQISKHEGILTPRYEFSRMETSFSLLEKHVKWAGNLHLPAYQGEKTTILKTKQKLLPWKGRCKYYLV
jgi:hypothetical protein